MNKRILYFVLWMLSLPVFSQELLTPENAVALALSKNFDIQIAHSEAEIAEINNNKGAAGMLPKINVTTGDVFNLNNINQKFTTGQVVKKNWVPINSFNASANLNWTVFDGLKMFATKDRLEALQAIGELQLQQQIQNTVADVLNAYYNVVRQKQQVKALNETFNISTERVNLSQKKLDVGYADKTPLLQAKVDLAAQQTDILQQQIDLENAKSALNQLIGRDPAEDYDVIDTIAVDYIPVLQSLKDSALTKNFSIQAAQKNIEVAKFQKKEIKAQRLPSINFATGYGFTQNNSKAGLQLFNRSYGPTVGVNAVIPIYNGGAIKKQEEAAAVNIAEQEIILLQLQNDLDNRLLTAYHNYQNAMEILKLNEDNVGAAQENVNITLERYRLNQSNSLDLREAQGSYTDALYAVILARYNAKLAEIELKRINNELVK